MAYRSGNYNFVIDSSFRPFTMQEMLVPFAAYKDAYDKMEEAYVDLNDKAGDFEYLSQTLPEGSKARQIYEGYANDLKTQADELTNNGLTMGSRAALTGLKRRYSSEIGRLKKVDEIRRAQIKEQNALRLQDPTRMFSRRADMTDFDKYLENPDLGYETYSGALLAQQVGTIAGNIAKGLNDAIKTGKLDDYTNTWIESHGYNVNDVRQALLDPANDRTGVLSAIVDDVVKSSRIPEWGDTNTVNEAYGWARQGLWQAIGQSQVHTYDNYGARLKAQEDMAARKAELESKLKQQEEAQKAGLALGQGLAINPKSIYSQKDMSDFDHNIKNYERYFTKDDNGHYRMNAEGLRAYNEKTRNTSTITSPTGVSINVGNNAEYDSGFKKFIDSIGGGKYIRNGKMQPGNLGNLWSAYKDRSKYDGTKSTEFEYVLYDSQRKEMKMAIQAALGNNELHEVDFNNKTNRFEPSGGSLNAEDLNNDKYSIYSTTFSPYGNTLIIKDDNGNFKRYNLPTGINPVNEQNRDKLMPAITLLQEMISAKKYRGKDGSIHDMSAEELRQAELQYKQLLQQAYLYHSQLGVTNKTKEQEFNPYAY